MPILWRYLISYFLKIVITCVLAFIAILFTMRLDEIAHFAALGASLTSLLFFTVNQIPYILPIALPLSCLIASLILVQRLSNSYELTAFRASGFSFFNILTPILLTAGFLSVANFWMTSEVATKAHLQTNLVKSELRSINPLLLLHNKHLMRLKGFYFETLGASHVGESASDIVLAMPNKHQKRINLMIAKKLKASPSTFTGQEMTFIAGVASEQEEDFDDLLIDHMGQSITQVQDFSNLLQKKVWSIHSDYLQMPLLLTRIQEQRQILENAQKQQQPPSQIKILKNHLYISYTEIIKRFSISLAVFSFTLMGAAFGINISRRRHHTLLYSVIILTTFYLICFFIAKGTSHHYWLASGLYIIPHFIIIIASLFVLKRAAKGIE